MADGRNDAMIRRIESVPTGEPDLDDPGGLETFAELHGPASFTFACGHTRFVALRAAPGVVGEMDVDTSGGAEGPGEEELAFLQATLAAATEPNRVVLMHMPPHLDGHYAPHADWGFERREAEFLSILREHRVTLVCCAHGLAFDTVVRDDIRFVMSGGGGTGLSSHFRGICTAGRAAPRIVARCSTPWS